MRVYNPPAMMARCLFLMPLAGALALAACEAKDPTILSFEGHTVHRSAFLRHVAVIESHGFGPMSRETRQGVLDAFLEERVLVLEARRRGLLAASASPEQERAAVLQLLATAGVERVSEEEIVAWRAENPAPGVVPERVTLRQILVGTQEEARDLKRRLARDGQLFATLARDHSQGPEAALGGYIGTFERGQLPPELEAAAFSLAAGGTSEPLQTPLGYHVLRVEARQAARDVPPEEARERIRALITRDKRRRAERAFVAALMARAKVNHEAALRPARRS